MAKTKQLISIIIPSYNEAANVDSFYKDLKKVLRNKAFDYELVYVNDGSRDDTLQRLHKLAKRDKQVRIVNLSRNFGKEIATTAGIHHAVGDALIMIDADGQHPPELIPEFIERWQAGSQVVVGVREKNNKEGFVKRYGSKAFYQLFNGYTGIKLVPGSTDFRLIDRSVQSEFIRLTERHRITRGLIDWLGFNHEYILFEARARMAGEASYSTRKLIGLALNSFISLSLKPLYFAFYVGVFIMPLATLLFMFSIVEMLVGDPFGLNITGTAFLVILALFLIGLLLVSQGITALYMSHIHAETQNRPLFVVDKNTSRGLAKK